MKSCNLSLNLRDESEWNWMNLDESEYEKLQDFD